MKRFISVLLVAILVVTSLSTFAFAADEPGTTKTIPITITNSDGFARYLISISAASPLTIQSISGAAAFVCDGNTARANGAYAANITSVTIYVTVSIPADIAPGTYSVVGSCQAASKVVPMEEDTDGIADGVIATTVSVGSGSVVIEAPVVPTEHTHTWSDWEVVTPATCHSDGLEKRTCVCGEFETRAITDRPDHNWSTVWENDADNHWHVCTNEGCTAVTSHEGHTWEWRVKVAAGYNKKGLKEEYCVICNRLSGRTAEIPAQSGGDDVPPMGDMTTTNNNFGIYAIAAVVVVLCGTAALVIKRKHVR